MSYVPVIKSVAYQRFYHKENEPQRFLYFKSRVLIQSIVERHLPSISRNSAEAMVNRLEGCFYFLVTPTLIWVWASFSMYMYSAFLRPAPASIICTVRFIAFTC
jgi:hypothetical protein